MHVQLQWIVVLIGHTDGGCGAVKMASAPKMITDGCRGAMKREIFSQLKPALSTSLTADDCRLIADCWQTVGRLIADCCRQFLCSVCVWLQSTTDVTGV